MPWRAPVWTGSMLVATTGWSGRPVMNARKSASSPGLRCPKAPASSTAAMGHLLIDVEMAVGDRGPGAVAGERARGLLELGEQRRRVGEPAQARRELVRPGRDRERIGRPGATR